MNKKYFITLLIILFLATAGFFIWKKLPASDENKATYTQVPDTVQTDKVNTISKNNIDTSNQILTPSEKNAAASNWKIYSNDKLGIRFHYPDTWLKQGKDAEVINLSGTIIKRGCYFSDSTNQTRFSLEYSLDSNAAKIFQYAKSQYNLPQNSSSNKNRIFLVDGSEAIEISKEFTVNGKGNKINPPLRIIIVDFMDKNKKGEIQIQFQTPVTKEFEEENNFQWLLSSFRFIKD
ncbi:MAG: hypothetical protein JST10_16610 [Bacteroidetes bacterium]|nr:hypothetical protein [Bacteroidota bacterium]MBS1634186.1 hypothetical protein [Bacteroidota bacterium]